MVSELGLGNNWPLFWPKNNKNRYNHSSGLFWRVFSQYMSQILSKLSSETILSHIDLFWDHIKPYRDHIDEHLPIKTDILEHQYESENDFLASHSIFKISSVVREHK